MPREQTSTSTSSNFGPRRHYQSSQLGSRITRQSQGNYSDDSDDDNYGDKQDDPDYVANDSDLEFNYSDYSDEDFNEKLEDLIADQEGDETVPKEMTFLEDLPQSFRDLKKGKFYWSEIYVNDLVNQISKTSKRVHEDGF